MSETNEKRARDFGISVRVIRTQIIVKDEWTNKVPTGRRNLSFERNAGEDGMKNTK